MKHLMTKHSGEGLCVALRSKPLDMNAGLYCLWNLEPEMIDFSINRLDGQARQSNSKGSLADPWSSMI